MCTGIIADVYNRYHPAHGTCTRQETVIKPAKVTVFTLNHRHEHNDRQRIVVVAAYSFYEDGYCKWRWPTGAEALTSFRRSFYRDCFQSSRWAPEPIYSSARNKFSIALCIMRWFRFFILFRFTGGELMGRTQMRFAIWSFWMGLIGEVTEVKRRESH